MQSDRWNITIFFSVITVTYIIHCAVLFPDGEYYKLVCAKYLRQIFKDASACAMTCIVIVSILLLHIKTSETSG